MALGDGFGREQERARRHEEAKATGLRCAFLRFTPRAAACPSARRPARRDRRRRGLGRRPR
jgi:hypothetical protein